MIGREVGIMFDYSYYCPLSYYLVATPVLESIEMKNKERRKKNEEKNSRNMYLYAGDHNCATRSRDNE